MEMADEMRRRDQPDGLKFAPSLDASSGGHIGRHAADLLLPRHASQHNLVFTHKSASSMSVRASRRALRALLSMRYVIDRIKNIPHPEETAPRSSRRTHGADPGSLLRVRRGAM